MKDKAKMALLAKAMAAVYDFGTIEKMTVVDLMALAVIYNNPGITMTETTKKLPSVPVTTAQYSFISFDKMGLIVKKPHPEDYKAKAIYLSAKGEKLAEAILGAFN